MYRRVHNTYYKSPSTQKHHTNHDRTDQTSQLSRNIISNNHASDYRTNRGYWTPNPNPIPVAR